jgi:citrate synthase
MMDECGTPINTGLRGVAVATTRISHVDGGAGKLIYRGYLVKALAENASFEEVLHLLLNEQLPTPDQLAAFKAELAGYRPLPAAIVEALKTMPPQALPMDVMQAAVALLAPHDPDLVALQRTAFERAALRLTARLAGVLAAWERIRRGNPPLAPDPTLDHAANFLYMLTGQIPAPDVARFFDACLVLHAEHAFNASTFAARQVASTRAHMYACIGAAIGALSGELHGGANVRVMEMLQAIGSPDNVQAHINQVLDRGGLLFGLGHAVYKVDDPRARILQPMAKIMGERAGQPQWYAIATELEKKGKEAFKSRKGIDIAVNVDFYSAPLYYAMGIAMDLFTPIFAISRIAGWSAHVIEERFADTAGKPALYRPESVYVGDYCGPSECAFVPMGNR